MLASDFGKLTFVFRVYVCYKKTCPSKLYLTKGLCSKGRILVGCFWFYVLILTSSYTANLAAFFTSTKQTEQQINIESLLKEGAQFTTIEHYALEQFLKSSNYKLYNRVHERMTIQKTLANGTKDALSKLEKDPSLYYLEEKPFIQWKVNKKPCDLKISKY